MREEWMRSAEQSTRPPSVCRRCSLLSLSHRSLRVSHCLARPSADLHRRVDVAVVHLRRVEQRPLHAATGAPGHERATRQDSTQAQGGAPPHRGREPARENARIQLTNEQRLTRTGQGKSPLGHHCSKRSDTRRSCVQRFALHFFFCSKLHPTVQHHFSTQTCPSLADEQCSNRCHEETCL